jgi:hypothetical protein
VNRRKRRAYKHSSDLQLALTVCSDAGIEGAPLCDQLASTQSFVKELKNPTPLNHFKFIKKFDMEDLYPKIRVSLRILLIVPVSVASGEGVFPNLNLLRLT